MDSCSPSTLQNLAAEWTVRVSDVNVNAAASPGLEGAVVAAEEVTASTPVLEVAEDGIHPYTKRVCRRVCSAFGLEEGLTPPTPTTLAMVNKSIELLAAELYAKEVHFILEVSSRCYVHVLT